MVWEGPEALEDGGSDVETVVPKASNLPKKPVVTVLTKARAPFSAAPAPPLPSPSEESGDGTEDEYIAEENPKSKGKVIYSPQILKIFFS